MYCTLSGKLKSGVFLVENITTLIERMVLLFQPRIPLPPPSPPPPSPLPPTPLGPMHVSQVLIASWESSQLAGVTLPCKYRDSRYIALGMWIGCSNTVHHSIAGYMTWQYTAGQLYCSYALAMNNSVAEYDIQYLIYVHITRI